MACKCFRDFSYHISLGFNSSKSVELLILQLQFLEDEGDKAELWELSRVYVDTLMEEITCEPSDRKPMEGEYEIIIMVVPDYQIFEYVERIASSLLDDPVIFGGIEGNSEEGPGRHFSVKRQASYLR
ncbi:hypothetical protein LguiB_005949 [Lonicera macranthoides]